MPTQKCIKAFKR